MNLKLYEISENYVKALTELSESGLDAATIADTLEGLEGELIAKGQNVCAYMLNCEAEANAIDEAAKKLAARAKTIRAQGDGLRDYLKFHMEKSGITEIKANDGTFKATIRKNPASVEITDADHIPDKYITVIPESRSPDKAEIKKAIQAGEVIPGAMLITDRTRLEIK